MLKDFSSAIKERRTFYNITPESKITNEQIKKTIEEAVLRAPSAFNSQSARVVLLLGEHHKKLWDITKEKLMKIVPTEQAQATKEKLDSFANGYGSVLYFDDETVVKGLQEQFPLYKDNFPNWAQQANGMLQYIIWTSLTIEGFGASLQHYNALIEEEVRKQWNISQNWKLNAQMPFGVPSKQPDEKTFSPLEKRFLIFDK